MPSFRKHFASKYYKAADIDDAPLDLTIKDAFPDAVQEGEPEKLCVSFVEPETKVLVINVTRGESISDLAGSENYERWAGTRVRLQLGYTRFQGKRTPCMEVVAPQSEPQVVTF